MGGTRGYSEATFSQAWTAAVNAGRRRDGYTVLRLCKQRRLAGWKDSVEDDHNGSNVDSTKSTDQTKGCYIAKRN